MASDFFGRLITTDSFGKKLSKRKVSKARLSRNQRNGKTAEDVYLFKANIAGRKVKRTGKGHDFKETTKDPFSGRVKTRYVEVKSSNSAPLSRLQKKTRAKSRNYKVVRETGFSL